jgi:tetratricopeptide (TPR) repeat protein
MFEVLLQAGKALEAGELDQAEESYWQIVELDPSNAIAVAGLARVSMERGDTRLARTFAERALVLDPESAAARRTLEALDGGATAAPGPERPDLPLPTTLRPDASRRLPASDADEAA